MNDDKDRGHILGAIGSIGTIGALGYYGIKELKRRRESFDKIEQQRISATSRSLLKNKRTVASNIEGLEKLTGRFATISVNASDIISGNIDDKILKKAIKSVDIGFIEQLNEFVKKNFSNRSANLVFEVSGKDIKNLSLSIPGAGRIRLGGIANKDNTIKLMGNRRKYFRKFLSPNASSSIIAGENFIDIAKNQVKGVNEIRVQILEQLLAANGNNLSYFVNRANDAMSIVMSHGVENLQPGSLTYYKHINSVLPLFMENDRVVKPSAFSEELMKFAKEIDRQYSKLSPEQKRKYPIHMLMKGQKETALGVFLDPSADLPEPLKAIAIMSEDFNPSNALRQIHNRWNKWAKPGKVTLKDEMLKNIVNATNLRQIRTYILEKNKTRNIFNELLLNDFINNGSMPEVFLEDEGALFSRSLLFDEVENFHNKIINFEVNGTGVNVRPAMDKIIGASVLKKDKDFVKNLVKQELVDGGLFESEISKVAEAAIKNGSGLIDVKGVLDTLKSGSTDDVKKTIKKLLKSTKNKKSTARIIRNYFGKVKNRDIAFYMRKSEAVRLAVREKFSDLVAAGQMVGLKLNLSEVFRLSHTGVKVPLTINEMGGDSIRLNNMIESIVSSEQGIKLEMVEKSKFKNVLKLWGTAKVVGAGENTELLKRALAATKMADELGMTSEEIVEYIKSGKGKKLFNDMLAKMKNKFVITSDPRIAKDKTGILRKLSEDATGNLEQVKAALGELDGVGFAEIEGFYNLGDTFENLGLAGSAANINAINYRRLKSQGFEEAAESLMAGAEEQIAYAQEIQRHVASVFGGDVGSKNYIGIDIEDLTSTDIDILYGSNIKKARKHAINIANRELSLNLLGGAGKSTVFYINLGDEKMPIPLFDSPYTGSGKINAFEKEGKEIRSDLNRTIGTYIKKKYLGTAYDSSDIRIAEENLKKALSETFASELFFTHKHPGSQMKAFVNHGYLDPDRIVKVSNYEEVLKKYGLTVEDLKEKSVVGFSRSEDFLRFATKSARGKSILKEMGIKNIRSAKESDVLQFKYRFMQDSSIGVTGRHPSYPVEGTTVSKVIDYEQLVRDIGRKQRPPKNSIFLNSVARQQFGADLDQDAIIVASIMNEEQEMATYKKFLKYKSPTLKLFEGGKGGLKSDIFREAWLSKHTASGAMETAAVSAKGVPTFFNAIMPYNISINKHIGDLAGEFTDSAHFTAQEKYFGLSNLFELLPEKSIGAKSPLSESGLIALSDILDVTNGMTAEDRVEKFREIISIPFENTDLMSEITDEELKSFFNAASNADQDIMKLLRNQLRSEGDVAVLYHKLRNTATTTEGIDIIFKNLLSTRQKSSTMRETILEAGDAISSTAKSIRRNKRFLAVGAGLLLAGYLTRSPIDNIKNQEAREESRSYRNRFPGEGQGAINPPVGIVGRVAGGMRYIINGTVGSGREMQGVIHSVSTPGGMAVINQSSEINQRYLYELQESNKQNNWNL